jgi:hypothetical protein
MQEIKVQSPKFLSMFVNCHVFCWFFQMEAIDKKRLATEMATMSPGLAILSYNLRRIHYFEELIKKYISVIKN